MNMRHLTVGPGTTEQVRSEGMVPICCDSVENALAAGILRAARGLLFIVVGTKSWRVDFCPFCGAAVDEHEVELLGIEDQEPVPVVERDLQFKILNGIRVCGRCEKPGHYKRKCPQ